MNRKDLIIAISCMAFGATGSPSFGANSGAGVPAAPAHPTPAYVEPANFSTIPAKINSGKLSLDAIWTMPKGKGPFAAVVLVHGAGAQDKDMTIGGSKPFKDIAEGLASKGIAVLRYEKRTRQFPETIKDSRLTVNEEVVDDAVAAIKTAAATPNINPKRVFVLGHTLGGMLAPRIAQKAAGSVAGEIVLAGYTHPLEDVMYSLADSLYDATALPPADKKKYADNMKAAALRVKNKQFNAATPASQLPSDTPASYWLDLQTYDPVKTAKQLGKPMLILEGARDAVVDQNSKWQGLPHSNLYTNKIYPDTDSLFASGSGQATLKRYLSEASTVSPKVINDIAAWVNTH